jgi:hypothetical protein
MLHRLAVKGVVLSLGVFLFFPTLGLSQKVDFAVLMGASKVPRTDLGLKGGNTQQESSPTAFAWQVNAGVRVFKTGPISALIELPFTAVPSQEFHYINISNAFPGNFGTTSLHADSAYFFTPGLRFRFLDRKVSPYAALGFGFERASLLNATKIDSTGASISANRSYKGAFDVGGGLDIGLHRHFALRAEFRDYIRTGQFVSASRHNLMAMGGGVFRF